VGSSVVAGLDPALPKPRRASQWRLDSREFARKLEASRAQRSVTNVGTKPVIFISYAHLDEPEKPAGNRSTGPT